ncbi:MAG TPA: hypothetical protein VGE40_14825 [Bacilli bacterium]
MKIDDVIEDGEQIIVQSANYRMFIIKSGFKYGFQKPGGEIIADAHAASGIRFTEPDGAILYDAETTKLISCDAMKVYLLVTNSQGYEADLYITPLPHYAKVQIIPRTPGKYIIDARTAPLNPVYGLGDYGSHVNTVLTEDAPARGKLDVPARDCANIFGIVRSDMVNQGTNMRFISNFTIFPARGFAQVLFEEGSKRVAFTEDENKLGAANVVKVDKLYYFIGDMQLIYRNYKAVREAEGYKDIKPKYEMFRLGWEAYGSLGWEAYQSAVQEAIQQYEDRGYEFAWGVIGSGFWKGDRKSPYQGTTTSFNIWDDTYEEGRTDGLPNPRFPDVIKIKKFFAEKDMKLILGIRNHFKAPESGGGYYDNVNNGPYIMDALEQDFLLKNPNGSLVKITNAEFPAGTVYVLDGSNRKALAWFKSNADMWEAQGFKEDAMIYTKHYADGNWNKFNEMFMDGDYYIIVRNSAYSVPGDLIRINDTYYGKGEGFHFDQDRMPMNLLNIAASGASNLYPDITGGTPKTDPALPSYQNYFVRNAMFNAVTPAMAMGRRPWEMNNPEYERIVKKAADWHNQYAPYIYSAVLDSYHSGYPYTMTPLHIAYADDPETYGLINRNTRQYEWMLGPSMLAVPVFGNDFDTAESRDVYLPAGKWIDYETGEVFHGPVTLKDYPLPKEKIPIFIGGKGVVVFQDPNDHQFYAEVYPIADRGSEYTYTFTDGMTKTTILNENKEWDPKSIVIMDTTAGKRVSFEYRKRTGSFRFLLSSGHDYQFKNLNIQK